MVKDTLVFCLGPDLKLRFSPGLNLNNYSLIIFYRVSDMFDIALDALNVDHQLPQEYKMSKIRFTKKKWLHGTAAVVRASPNFNE